MFRESAFPFEHPAFDGHEQVVFCHDRASGLSAIVAIHDTRLGPALGGCRMWAYPTGAEALADVLRLSRGMTYKNAVAGLDLGGGKAVVLGDPVRTKTRALLAAFGDHVERLGGRYVTAEDVGMTVEDLDVIATRTAHARGITSRGLGNPAPYTADGVVAGIRAALARVFGSDDPAGRTVAISGVGQVGGGVADRLAAMHARLLVSDADAARAESAAERTGARIVPVEDIHRTAADVFSPCALGGVLNERTIPEIATPIVAGAANNQLLAPEDAARLAARGILYAPDYVINAGGVISIALGEDGDVAAVEAKIAGIGDTLALIFARAEREGRTTAEIADRIAEERLAGATVPA